MSNKKNILVVYYSRSGSTKKVAENISRSLGCDIEEIKATQSRKGIFGLIKSGYEAVNKKTTIIKEMQKDPSNYDVTIIGTPVWASGISSATRTYIEQNRDKFNDIAFFCTFSGSREMTASKALREINSKDPLLAVGIKKSEADKTLYIDKFKNLL